MSKSSFADPVVPTRVAGIPETLASSNKRWIYDSPFSEMLYPERVTRACTDAGTGRPSFNGTGPNAKYDSCESRNQPGSRRPRTVFTCLPEIPDPTVKGTVSKAR